MAEPFPEERSVVDIIAKLREVKLGRAKVIGSLGLEELRTDPLQDTGLFVGGGLLYPVACRRNATVPRQAPLLENIVVKACWGRGFPSRNSFLRSSMQSMQYLLSGRTLLRKTQSASAQRRVTYRKK